RPGRTRAGRRLPRARLAREHPGGGRSRGPTGNPPHTHWPCDRVRADCPAAECRAREQRCVAGTCARQHGESGAIGMGGTRPDPRRAHHGLPARVRQCDIGRPNPRWGHQRIGGDEMTAVTVPVRPAKDSGLRPLPWRRMVWVSWRHHRVALGGGAVFLGVLATWLWTAGLSLHHTYAVA